MGAYQSKLTAAGNYWVDTNGRIFQRADASNSLNVVSPGQIIFFITIRSSNRPYNRNYSFTIR